jgi:valyl-tRNA synthetase
VSTANNGIAPYGKILTHGFTVDEKGEKMSKSKGNVVAPNDIAKSHGVEILRLWVGTSEYTTDLKISENILKQISEQYRKIRNTFRFLLANVNDLETIMPISEMTSAQTRASAEEASLRSEDCLSKASSAAAKEVTEADTRRAEAVIEGIGIKRGWEDEKILSYPLPYCTSAICGIIRGRNKHVKQIRRRLHSVFIRKHLCSFVCFFHVK